MYGKAEDVNKNSVVLKVNGNLTLDSGYTLTSVKSGTAVGKGLFIYCTGTATINGTVNMSGVTCSAEGSGYGYDFTYTKPNGETGSGVDSHWICGGGGKGNSDFQLSNTGGKSSNVGVDGTSWIGGVGR